MRLFIRIYADDIKSPSSTNPLMIKGTAKDITLAILKSEIESNIKPIIKVKNQVLSIKKNAVIVSEARQRIAIRYRYIYRYL